MLLEKLRADGDDFDVGQVEADSLIEESLNLSNNAINELMSEEIQPHISNAQDLMKKMLGYNEVFNGAQVELKAFFDKKAKRAKKAQREEEKKMSESKSRKTIGATSAEAEDDELQRAIEESKREAQRQSIKASIGSSSGKKSKK